MKIKYTLGVLAIVAFTKTSYAQYSQDAIRFSNTQTGSTSRIKAIGNAGTAVGGDLSNITGNPAGLGFFTKSEFSVTPEFDGSRTNSSLYGNTNTSNKSAVNLNNASVLFYSQLNNARNRDKTKGWLSLNFGANYARTNNFYDNSVVSGRNANGSSVADYFADRASYLGVGDLENAAINQGLISAAAGGGYNPNTSLGPNQSYNAYRSGGQSDYGFSVGANYSNKLYLGLGINFTDIRYNATSLLYESGNFINSAGITTNPYNAVYETDQRTRGTGFNARFGAIYKPVEAVRIGASVTTPTWYNVDDGYFEGTSVTGRQNTTGSNYGVNYNLRTPFKASGGLAIFIQQYGFITGDVEYVDYSTTHLSNSSDGYADNYVDFTNDNADIKQYYRSTVNLHFGAEARLTPSFFLRGGYGIQGSPEKDLETSVKTASGGLGYRFGSYYIDATYTHASGTIYTQPYLLSADYLNSSTVAVNNPYVDQKRQYNNVFLTLGVRF